MANPRQAERRYKPSCATSRASCTGNDPQDRRRNQPSRADGGGCQRRRRARQRGPASAQRRDRAACVGIGKQDGNRSRRAIRGAVRACLRDHRRRRSAGDGTIVSQSGVHRAVRNDPRRWNAKHFSGTDELRSKTPGTKHAPRRGAGNLPLSARNPGGPKRSRARQSRGVCSKHPAHRGNIDANGGRSRAQDERIRAWRRGDARASCGPRKYSIPRAASLFRHPERAAKRRASG